MKPCFAILAAVAAYGTTHESTRVVKSVVRPHASGKLVRSVVVTPAAVKERVVAAQTPESAAAPAEPPGTFKEVVDRIARQHEVEPELVHSVIRVESNYNPGAVSPKGALGIMQLIPATARRFGVADVFNPVQNIQGGVKYLKYLLELFNGDYRLALAGYNAGEAAVARYGGIPPYPETRSYVYNVGKKLGEAREVEKLKPAAVAQSAPARLTIQEYVTPDGTVHIVSR